MSTTNTDTCTTHSETISINTGEDGEIYNSDFLPEGELWDGENVVCVGSWHNDLVWGFWRFQLPQAIAEGATVTNAYLSLANTYHFSWIDPNYGLDLVAINQSNPLLPAHSNDYPGGASGLVATSAKVNWRPGAWSGSPSDLNTPDLKTIIQELVNTHNGLSNGAHLLIFSSADEDTIDDYQESELCFAHSTHTTAAPPKLTIQWKTCQE